MKPIYTHDCDECKFIGTFIDKYDLYICKTSVHTSIIFRDGNESHEYASHPCFDFDDRLKNTPRPGGITDNDHIFIMAVNCLLSVLLNNFKENKEN